MCTVKGVTEKLKGGYKIEYYTSYIFGGIIQEHDGRFCPTNDLIEVVSKRVVLDKSQDVESLSKPSLHTTSADEVIINIISQQGGKRPMPRRDHSAIMIRNNEFMLVYGGKNESAFQYKASELVQNYEAQTQRRRINQFIYEEITNSTLDDIMLFNLATREWSAVAQRGWRPEARWSSAICYNESSQQLFIFGGSGANGSCRAEVFCCDLNLDRVNFCLSELQN